MNGAMTYEEALTHLTANRMVLVRTRARRGSEGSQHWGRGFLIAARPRYAVIRPFGHGKDEAVSWDSVRYWTAGNAGNRRQTEACVA